MRTFDSSNIADFEEYIRSKVDIVDVVREYVHLTKKGRFYVGCCPFHPPGINKELGVYPNQLFLCKSADKHNGDVIKFVAMAEKVNRREAIRILARKLGIRANLIDEIPSRRQQSEISHYEILTYKLCPQRYKYFYIDRMSEKIYKPYLIVGTIIHNVLSDYLAPGQEDKSLDRLLSLLFNKWGSVVLENAEEENIWFSKAVDILDSFYKKHEQNVQTICVEQGFKEKVTTKTGKTLVLKGRFDRLDRVGPNEYAVIDYKTFEKPRTVEELKEDLGYVFYYFGAAPFCVNTKGPKNVIYYYLTEGEKVTIETNEAELETGLNEIEKMLHDIETTTDFKPIRNIYCGDCAFASECSLQIPK